MRNNKVYANVAGIEIENSTDSEVYGNTVYDNTAGILVLNLPDLPVQDGRRANVHDNEMRENNRANFAIAGTTVAGVPPGVGILVLAADETHIHANTFRSNDSTGVLIVSCYTNNNLSIAGARPAYDQFPQQTYIHENTYESNGMKPAPDFTGPLGVTRLEDIAWDGDIDTTAIRTTKSSAFRRRRRRSATSTREDSSPISRPTSRRIIACCRRCRRLHCDDAVWGVRRPASDGHPPRVAAQRAR